MTQQEIVEQSVRLLLGDLQLQLIMARARIAELEQSTAPAKSNGSGVHTDEERQHTAAM